MSTLYRYFSALIGIFVVLVVVPSSVFAATPAKTLTVTPSPVASPTPTRVEYVLPYPGILPTHPLYFLKSLRDKIIEMLAPNPLSKADFYIHQADKKLNMGITLRELGKINESRAALADSLASRTQSVTLIEEQIKAGTEIPGHLTQKLLQSLSKHKEVLTDVGEKVEGVEALVVRVQQMLAPKQ